MATTYELPPNIAPPLYLNLKQKRHVMVEGGSIDGRWLAAGLCHTTKEAAELHRKALILVSGGTP